MSSIDESLVSILEDSAAVAALVGARIYPLRALQTAMRPHLVYQRTAVQREYSHSGPSGLAQARFQVRCVASSFSQARQVADAVRGALSGFQGTVGGVRIDAVFLDDDLDTFDVAPDDEATLVGAPLQFLVWYGE